MNTLIPTVLDVDRLHKVTEKINQGLPRDRGEGSTVAYLYLAYGEIGTGDGARYVYVGHNAWHVQMVASSFMQLLLEHFPAEYTERAMTARRGYAPTLMFLPTGQTFQFVGFEQAFLVPDGFRGVEVDRLFHDVDPWVLSKLTRTERYQYDLTCHHMVSRGTEII